MSFFRELYEGRFEPVERKEPSTKEYRQQLDISINMEKQLMATLTKEQKVLFEAYQNAQSECELEYHVQAFKDGFMKGIEFEKDRARKD